MVSTWCTDSSRSSGSMPSEKVRQACGSRSTRSTDSPSSASAAPIEATDVVFATPPFWLATASTVGTGVVDIASHHARRPCPDRASAGWLVACLPLRTSRPARPGDRPDGRPRPGLRGPSRPARLRPGARRPRRDAAEDGRRRARRGVRRVVRGAGRRPRRPRPAADGRGPPGGSSARPTVRPVDLLVNNAGFGLKRTFLHNTVEQEQALLDVLVTAPMRLTHAALRQMTARHTGGIINVSSVAGTQPRGSYSAAKAYLNRFGEWAAHEYAGDGVRIMTLLPGFTRTEFHERMDVGRDAVPRLALARRRPGRRRGPGRLRRRSADLDPEQALQGDRDREQAPPGRPPPALPVPRPPLGPRSDTSQRSAPVVRRVEVRTAAKYRG